MSVSRKSTLLEPLLVHIGSLRARTQAIEQSLAAELARIHPEYQHSAKNLLHYLALRQYDLRELQSQLSYLGLSSLGRSEAHVLATLNAVWAVLHSLAGRRPPSFEAFVPPVDFATGPALLQQHAEVLLGPPGPGSTVRIMVTMPSEAAVNYALVRDLVAAGMDIMRINCAHDDRQVWTAMVEHFRRARQELQRSGRVLVDLGGPKLRTGAVEESARLVRWQPRRDARGLIISPAHIWLTSAEAPMTPPTSASAVLPVNGAFLAKVKRNDVLQVVDARRKRTTLTVVEEVGNDRWAESLRTTYVEAGAQIQLHRVNGEVEKGTVGDLPVVMDPLVLHSGETLLLVPATQKGRAAQLSAAGTIMEPAKIPCSLPEVFRDARPGERILFDDGKITGVIRSVKPELIDVTITHARLNGAKLRSDKGINLPDTALHLPALTPKDLQDLDFAAGAADMVGFSFVRTPEDVAQLQHELAVRGTRQVGVVLKIETRLAFENLPRLLLAGLRTPPLGVMVARGDLAAELGFERMAEVQEEILWLCEAAHVPVIWATQVLESLAKKGAPSRAEVTDAAMSGRAECVMLNKGPYIVEAVEFLNSVLQRMEQHQQKKRSMLRKLSVSSLEQAARE
ncbi:MAG: pyruvate kinase [Candidatus Binatia bacterium]